MLRSPRSLINQLRVAYFVPKSAHWAISTAEEESRIGICRSGSCCDYHSFAFKTPVVPFVGHIPSVTGNLGNEIQTSSVVPHNNPLDSYANPQPFCVPTVKIICSFNDVRPHVPAYRLGLLDFSAQFRSGYRNAFHQYGDSFCGYPLLIKGQPLNIYF